MEDTSFSTATVFGGAVIDSNSTVYSGNSNLKGSDLGEETVFDGRYKIISKIGGESSQAKVYLCENIEDDNQVVIKVYAESYQPDYDMLEKFKKLDSPYLAKLLGYGTYEGQYYEVYKYYKNGNIMQRVKETPLTSEFIENVAIESLNEALHSLHEIGVVHADVKPENILISDDEQSLVLGDYGISVQLEQNDCAYREIQGTLAYAPRAEQHFTKMKIDKAWDYGSMGLVLIALICGRGIFDSMNNDEIFREWERGVEIPSIITGRLKSLIVGLIESDSTKRFGYKEVKRWCEGDIVNTGFKRNITVTKTIQPLIVAIVGSKVVTVSSPEEFAREILKNWDAARARIFENPTGNSVIRNFLVQFDDTYYESVTKFLQYNDKDIALFCVAYTLFPMKDIYYKGKFLGNLENLFSSENISSNADELMAFVKSDLLEYYLQVNEYPRNVMSSIKALVDLAGNDGPFLYYLLMYSFSKEKILHIDGFSISNMDELSDAVVKTGVEKILSVDYKPQLYGWLYCMGYGQEVEMMRKRDNNEQ